MHGMRRAPALLLLCLLLLTAGGCSGRLLAPGRTPARRRQESLNALASATQAYKAGDYDRAGDLFWPSPW